MMIRTIIAMAALLLFVSAPTARGEITNVMPTRTVNGQVLSRPPSTFSYNLPGVQECGLSEVGIALLEIDPYDHSVVAANAISGGGVPEPANTSMMGYGSATMIALATGPVPVNGQAQSLFDFSFEVSSEKLYRLAGDFSWVEDVSLFSGFSQITLFDSSNSSVVAQALHTSSQLGTYSFEYLVQLMPGATYWMTAEAFVSGGAIAFSMDHETTSTFSFTLSEVPEPTAGFLLFGGLLCTSCRRWPAHLLTRTQHRPADSSRS